jgi:uncharacterized protein YndB with AHSA1/START domain
MTDRTGSTDSRLELDQLVSRPPAAVWRALTEPDLLAAWWVPNDIAPVVGHRFHLDMGEWGKQPCEVLEVDPERRILYTFGSNGWTLDWRLVPEGRSTRVLLTHAGFDLDDERHRFAFDQMGPGWRDEVLPRLAALEVPLP